MTMRFSPAVWMVFLSLLAIPAHAQVIDIKGLRFGTLKSDVVEKFGTVPLRGFTIAGVPVLDDKTAVYFRDDELDSLHFSFSSEEFDEVMEAVKEKYPKMRCKKSGIANRMGARFRQTDCSLSDERGVLSLTRYLTNLDTSSLSMQSHESIREFIGNSRKRAGNL